MIDLYSFKSKFTLDINKHTIAKQNLEFPYSQLVNSVYIRELDKIFVIMRSNKLGQKQPKMLSIVYDHQLQVSDVIIGGDIDTYREQFALCHYVEKSP